MKFSTHNYKRARSSGFTLIELLVVLGILLVLTTVSVSTVSGLGSPKQALRRDAREVLSLLGDSRRAAMVRKLKINVYVDDSEHTVLAVESGYARELLQSDESIEYLTDLELENVSSNRFFKTVVLDDDFSLDVFTADQIEVASQSANFFQQSSESVESTEEVPRERLAFSFTHFGGATGGGISLTRDGVRLDLACDILTGRATPVTRSGEIAQ